MTKRLILSAFASIAFTSAAAAHPVEGTGIAALLVHLVTEPDHIAMLGAMVLGGLGLIAWRRHSRQAS